MTNSNGEFKGTTKQAIKDMGGEIAELKIEVKANRKWIVVLTLLTTVAVIERLPDLIKIVTVIASN